MKADNSRGREALPGAELGSRNLELGTQNQEGKRTHYDLGERLLEFSARIIRLVDSLNSGRGANHVGGQLLRSGTSALPNHGEAQAAESLNDFIHKLKVCLKELVESLRWLKLIHRVPLVDKAAKVEPLLKETDELCRIFRTSIKTCRRRAENAEDSRVREAELVVDSDPWLMTPWLLSQDDSKFQVPSSKFQVRPPAGPMKYGKGARKK